MNKKYVLDIPDLNTFKNHIMAHTEYLMVSVGQDVINAIKPDVIPHVVASEKTEKAIDNLFNFIFESIKDSHLKLVENNNGIQCRTAGEIASEQTTGGDVRVGSSANAGCHNECDSHIRLK